jgi:hypothetical protein
LKKHNNSGKKSEPTSKSSKSRPPVPQDTKEVLAELVGKLRKKLDANGGSREQRRQAFTH